MMRRRSILLGAGMASLASTAMAQERVKSGTVEIEQVQVAFIGSGNVGGGTLFYEGRSYRFSIGGLGIGGFGISKLEATGTVYNMKRLNQFPGAYGQARSGYALGNDGTGKLWLENTNGVLLELHAKRTGVALSMGADAVYIDFR
jgi:hypothetical protein